MVHFRFHREVVANGDDDVIRGIIRGRLFVAKLESDVGYRDCDAIVQE